MRHFLVLILLASSLWAPGGPARAQATADQMNKLSLEALTTPAPGGNPGARSYRTGRSYGYRHYAPRSYRRHASYGRAYHVGRHRSYARRPAYRRAGYGGYARPARRTYHRR